MKGSARGRSDGTDRPDLLRPNLRLDPGPGARPIRRPGRHRPPTSATATHSTRQSPTSPSATRTRTSRTSRRSWPRSRPDALKPSQGSSDAAPAQRGGHQIQVGPAVGSLGPCGGLTNAMRGQDRHAAAGQGEGCGGTSHRHRKGRPGRAGCAPGLRQLATHKTPAIRAGWLAIRGSTCTSPRPARPGSTLVRAAHRAARPPRSPQERRRPGARRPAMDYQGVRK